ACFSPLRLATTAIEALLLVGAVRLVVLLPFLRTRNLEGPRKIALVFTLSFLMKYALGWVVAKEFPSVQVTDLFGFGYILPSLIAAKMLQKEQIGQVLSPTYQAAIVALVAGSLVGFGLDQIAPAEAKPAPPQLDVPVATQTLVASAGGVAAIGHVRA